MTPLTAALRAGAPNSRPKVLLVDDDPRILSGLRRQLHRHFDVQTAESGVAGLEILRFGGEVAVVVSDMRMPGMDGAAFLALVRAESPLTTRVLLTGQTEFSAAVRAINDGQIFRFLHKPCPPEVLDRCLHEGVARYEAAHNDDRLLSSVLGDRRVIDTPGNYGPRGSGPRARVQNRRFRLRYQRIVDISNAAVIGVEAVVCGADPEALGAESTQVPLDDVYKMDLPLGKWAVAAACQEVASWPVLAADPLRMHIRLGAEQLLAPGIADDLARTLTLSGLEPHRATLEIAQHPALEVAITLASLATVSQWGIRVGLIVVNCDKAVAEVMADLPVDSVRLAAGSATDRPRGNVEAVLDIAKRRRLLTIADRVDTVEHLATARGLGFDLSQGALYGPPADAGDLLAQLAAGYH